MIISELKLELSSYLDCYPGNLILTSKGRVGLFGLLSALGVTDGVEVILPAYTCVVVPNAVIYLGAIPIYVEIDPLTYNMDPNRLEEKISDRTKVIIAQNTYGLSSEIDAINRIALKYNIDVIEDCTHGFGGRYNGILNGKHVKASFFSSQWNKMFSTGIGGIVMTNDAILAEKMILFEKSLQSPSHVENGMLRLQIFLKDILGYSSLYWVALKLYRYLSSQNIISGSSSGEEIVGTQMPPEYLKGYSEVQASRAIKELARISQNINHRRKCAEIYNKELFKIGIIGPKSPNHIFHTYTKYPVLVKDRDLILEKAEKENIPIHDWFISPIHPVKKDFEKWYFRMNNFPLATSVAKHVINLPTDFMVSDKLLRRICSFVSQNKNEFVNYNDL